MKYGVNDQLFRLLIVLRTSNVLKYLPTSEAFASTIKYAAHLVYKDLKGYESFGGALLQLIFFQIKWNILLLSAQRSPGKW